MSSCATSSRGWIHRRDRLDRAELVASQMAGLLVTRYVLGLEPLASLSVDALVPLVAPNLQRYLTGELPI